ncbi:MAG: AI-2E family transporter [Actinobacteria bacterium]|nr:AI-2E family transporter [Actinomycetota bacterium]
MSQNPPNSGNVPPGLAQAAAYSWRILAVGLLGYVALSLLGQLQLVVVALFVGLILAAIVGPLVGLANRVMPRPLAVAVGLIVFVGGFVGIIVFIATSVTGQWESLAQQFVDGVGQMQRWLEGPPLNIQSADFTVWYQNGQQWIVDNRGELFSGVIGSAGTVLEVVATIALALFSAVFFLAGGSKIWAWAIGAFPQPTKARIDGAGLVAWRSFAGYTRGIIIVAASNAIFVCVLLLILGVPLALPLALLVFFGTFIPLIGAPIAMFVSVVVALAARGPVIALIVLIGIFVLGQLEGHILQPLVMSKAVNIHPLAVAVSVASGTLLAGLFGAVIAVPVVSVCYAISKFWFQTAPAPNK